MHAARRTGLVTRVAAVVDGVGMADLNRLILHVLPGQDSDEEELTGLASQLQAELLLLDLRSVAPLPARDVPPGAKGIGQLAGWLVAQFGTAVGLRDIINGVRGWAARAQRTVEITMDGDTLKIGAATAQQQQEIIDAWLARHRTSA